MINDFDFKHGNMLLEHTKLIIDPILKLKKQMQEKGFPIIYINDHYDLWQADFDKIIDTCKNERNGPLIETIKPQQDEFFLIKPKHSAFYGTTLNTLLKRLKVETLIITGIAGKICVLFTAKDAIYRNINYGYPRIASLQHQRKIIIMH